MMMEHQELVLTKMNQAYQMLILIQDQQKKIIKEKMMEIQKIQQTTTSQVIYQKLARTKIKVQQQTEVEQQEQIQTKEQ